MACVGEEIVDEDGNISELNQEEFSSTTTPTSLPVSPTPPQPSGDVSVEHSLSATDMKDEGRKLSFEGSQMNPKSPRHSKSRGSTSSRKSILKERRSTTAGDTVVPDPSSNKGDDKTFSSQTEINPEDSDALTAGNEHVLDPESGGAIPQCSEMNLPDVQQKDLWMELEDFFECFRYSPFRL